MIDKALSLFPYPRLIRPISLAQLLPFFRKKPALQPQYQRFMSSIYSQLNDSSQDLAEEEICPLVEAEVFVIYGRTDDAAKALNAGIQSGRITAGQAAQFWSAHP